MGKRFKVTREQPRAGKDGRATPSGAGPIPTVRFTWHFYVLAAALIAATFAVYWQTTHFPLLDVDDPDYVTLNTNVRAGLTWASFRWAFNLGYAANWHPMTWLSHMADCQFFGMLPGQIHGTGGHHLTNLLLHSASVVLLFGLLQKLTRQLWPSAFVAALFAVHPLHVESVAWVAERKDVLSTFFLMLTLCAYARYVSSKFKVVGWFLITAVFYACGLMSKQMLVSAPILFLLIDYWPLHRFYPNRNTNLNLTLRPLAKLIAEKIPFILMAIGASIAVVLAQGTGGAISDRIPFSNRLNNAIVTYVIYIGDMFYPHNLAHYYPHEMYNWQAFDVIGCFILLAAITAATIWLARSRPYLLVGWLWYLVTLVPVIGIVQVGGQARADRYTYIPSIGIIIIVAFGAADLLKSLLAKQSVTARRAIQIGVATLALLATTSLAIAAHKQVTYWQSGETLCKHTLSVTKNNWFVHSALAAILNGEGDALRANGKSAEADKKNQEAVEHLKETLRIMPGMANAHVILANAYLDMNKLDDAVDEFHTAITLQPNNSLAHCNLANTLKKQGKMSDAIAEYETAVRLEPTHADTRYNYALVLKQSGRTDEALQEFQRTLQCFPSDLAAYWAQEQMAEILLKKGQKPEAIALLQSAAAINDRSHVDPMNNIARTMLQQAQKTP